MKEKVNTWVDKVKGLAARLKGVGELLEAIRELLGFVTVAISLFNFIYTIFRGESESFFMVPDFLLNIFYIPYVVDYELRLLSLVFFETALAYGFGWVIIRVYLKGDGVPLIATGVLAGISAWTSLFNVQWLIASPLYFDFSLTYAEELVMFLIHGAAAMALSYYFIQVHHKYYCQKEGKYVSQKERTRMQEIQIGMFAFVCLLLFINNVPLSEDDRAAQHESFKQNESYKEGVKMSKKRDFAKAIKYLEACHQAAPQNTLCLWELGWAYKADFQLKNSIKTWEKLAKIDLHFHFPEKKSGTSSTSLRSELKNIKELYVESKKDRTQSSLMSYQEVIAGELKKTRSIEWKDSSILFAVDGEKPKRIAKNCTEGPVFKSIECIKGSPLKCREISSFEEKVIKMLDDKRKKSDIYPHFKEVLAKFTSHCECPKDGCDIDALFRDAFE